MDSGSGGAGTVAIAQQQTAGRGQRGRVWQSELGGLYLSLALEPDWPIYHSAQLTCMSAWGIATAFNNLGIPIQIKWPNDLFFEGKKLGGILTETRLGQSPIPDGSTQGSQQRAVIGPPRIKQAVIGVGLNWQNSVPDTAITLTKIMAQLPDCPAQNKINCLEVLVALILKGILQGYLFQQQVGSQVFMKTYSNLLTQVGKVVLLDSRLLSLAVTGEHFGGCDRSLSDGETFSAENRTATSQLASRSADMPAVRLPDLRASQVVVDQFANRSGEIVGVSEEGYLKVAIHPRAGPVSAKETASKTTGETRCTTNILLLKPSEICIS